MKLDFEVFLFFLKKPMISWNILYNTDKSLGRKRFSNRFQLYNAIVQHSLRKTRDQ